MGSFSWTKADNLTQVKNVVCGASFKLLIPKEFGGGYIKDNYQDYGLLGEKPNGEPKYDMYELLAFWNREMLQEDTMADTGNIDEFDGLRYDGEFPSMKEIDKYTDHNRNLGINIGCNDAQIDKLKYPLKLVSCSYTGTYEDCDGKSYGDAAQGFYEVYRE